MFPRQSGKNELQAWLEAWLLALHAETGGEIVKVSPTWRPQSLNAMRRLERCLERSPLTRARWRRESGHIYRLGLARAVFLSAQPGSNVVGATASILLECDEAQDVQIDKWDREINPMAASTNAARIFWGTAWTDSTLLGRELRAARSAEAGDGLRRAFVLDADQVAEQVPAYGRFVQGEITRLGRNHPHVRTQYFSEELGEAAGMFPTERLERMRGNHPARLAPEPGRSYAFLLDLAGEAGPDEAPVSNQRDAAALTIVEIDPVGLDDPLLNAPLYRVVGRRRWTGEPHPALYGQILQAAEIWRPVRLVVDATGIGAPTAAFLGRTFGRAPAGMVVPFVFSQASKSKLGWDFLAIVDTGRFRDFDPAGDDPQQSRLQDLFRRECRYCRFEPLPGPERRLRWGVPDGLRDPASGEPVHDDLLVSAALCAVLEQDKSAGWTAVAGTGASGVIASDPIWE
jgi:hypothetical protein